MALTLLAIVWMVSEPFREDKKDRVGPKAVRQKNAVARKRRWIIDFRIGGAIGVLIGGMIGCAGGSVRYGVGVLMGGAIGVLIGGAIGVLIVGVIRERRSVIEDDRRELRRPPEP